VDRGRGGGKGEGVGGKGGGGEGGVMHDRGREGRVGGERRSKRAWTKGETRGEAERRSGRGGRTQGRGGE